LLCHFVFELEAVGYETAKLTDKRKNKRQTDRQNR